METENEEIIYLDDSSDESGDESNESDLDEEKEEIKIENLSKIQPEIVTLSDSDSENDSTNEEIFDENNVNTKVDHSEEDEDGPEIDPYFEMDPDEKRTKLFVNYLPQSWTDIDLNSIFMEIGPLKEAKVFKDAKTNYSFGYGIVNYESPDDAAQAVKTKNGFQIGGKKLKVVYSRENFGPETKIYLKFIGENEAAVRELFLPFGEILDFKLLKYQGNLRGDGFVRFAKTEQAKAAILAMNGVKAPGTDANMLVKMAEEHGKQKGDYFAQCLTTQIGKRPNNYQQQPDFMSKRSKVDS